MIWVEPYFSISNLSTAAFIYLKRNFGRIGKGNDVKSSDSDTIITITTTITIAPPNSLEIVSLAIGTSIHFFEDITPTIQVTVSL